MKKFYIMFVLGTAAALSAGCFEDKGNYEYTNVNEVIVELDKTTAKITLGETIEVKPTIKFASGTGNTERLRYKWYLGVDKYTEPDWNTLDFKWTPGRVLTNQKLRLEVTDPVTGLQSYAVVTCDVVSIYEDYGVLVLSEVNGRTQYSFVKFMTSAMQYGDNYTQLHPFEFIEYVDAYKTDNGEDLPEGPLEMHQHFCTDGSTIGQILVLTRNGAIDINGKDFKKEATLVDEFEGRAYPAGMDYVTQAMSMYLVDLVTDPEGHVYSRLKNTPELFHSGTFLPNRLAIDGEELSGCRLITAPYRKLCGCLVYDGIKKRLLIIGDGGSSSVPNGIFVLDNPSKMPEDFVPVTDMSGVDILWMGYNQAVSAYDSTQDYAFIINKGGKIFCQEFGIDKDYYSFLYAVVVPKVSEIQGLPGVPTCIYSTNYRKENGLVYLAVGNQLYIYDRNNPTLPVTKYGDFRADIVKMDGDIFNSRWLTLGLADGSVMLLNAAKTGLAANRYVYYDSMREEQKMPLYKDADGNLVEVPNNEGDPVNFGKIIDVRLKIQGGSTW